MSEIVTDELLCKLQILSALEIDEKEKGVIKKDIETMIDFVGQIQSFDIDKGDFNIDNLQYNIFREDKVLEEKTQDNISLEKNAPLVEDGYIVVPKTT